MNENAFAPSTSALALLRRGFTLTTPDGRFIIIKRIGQKFVIFNTRDGSEAEYPLSTAGLQQAAERVNLPF